MHVNVTCVRGAGGISGGDRSIAPVHDGQLKGVPFRSFATRYSACAGLYELGRGFRIRGSLCDVDGQLRTTES